MKSTLAYFLKMSENCGEKSTSWCRVQRQLQETREINLVFLNMYGKLGSRIHVLMQGISVITRNPRNQPPLSENDLVKC